MLGSGRQPNSPLCFPKLQVTLFAYSDLLLFTKEDEPGRCNVLRNPLYLQSVKLQEGEVPQGPRPVPLSPIYQSLLPFYACMVKGRGGHVPRWVQFSSSCPWAQRLTVCVGNTEKGVQ